MRYAPRSLRHALCAMLYAKSSVQNKMKILLISPHLPGPKTYQAGERLVFELIQILSEKHEIHLVVRLHEGQEKDLGPVEALCKKVYPVHYKRPLKRGLFGLLNVVASYYRLCQKANALAEAEAFEAIHAEWTETGFFLSMRHAPRAMPFVIEAHDVLTKPMERRYLNAKGFRRYAYLMLFRFTKIFERYIYNKFDTVFVLSKYDQTYLRSMAPSLKVAVLQYPYGINLTDTMLQREEKTLLFLAAMDRGPNVEAVLYFWNEILPLVRKQVADVKFCIAGSRPLPGVRALAEKDKDTIVTGFVDDIEPYYKSSTIFVAPLLTGGGIIVKVLDALAAGTPVVTTSIGNEGIGAIPGEHLLIADTPADFASQVVRLLQDKPKRDRIGRAGRDFVSGKFSRDVLRKTLEQFYPTR
jgi:glycosyltransferase involved in cell wall biosynthesis